MALSKMKIDQMKEVLEYREKWYREDGNSDRANMIHEFILLLDGHEKKTVATFTKLIKEKWATKQ